MTPAGTMTPAELDAARGVSRIAVTVGATTVEVRRVLACLGCVPPGDSLAPLPTRCGHPSSALRRRPDGAKGFRCVDCAAERRDRRNAAKAAS